MATTNSIQDPIFEELAYIQASLDEFTNHHDGSKPLQCRALLKDGSRRCQNNGWLKDQHAEVEALFVEFKNMTKCPETDILYEKLEVFITYTHCKRHVEVALESFREWAEQQTTAASSSPPMSLSASASASPSPLSSSEYVLSTSLSEISDLLAKTSLSGGPIYDEPVSDCDSEGIWEKHEKVVTKEILISPDTSKIDKKMNPPKGGPKAGTKIRGLGDIGAPRRQISIRDHATVFQVINSHPKEGMMKEGTVYILEHMNIPGLYKIGFSTIGADQRLKHPKNCYGTDTKIIHETESKFRGARQAEKIIQTRLFHDNILVQACEKCGGGHREWFEAPRDKIFETVTTIEAFVQMPAYVKKDGEWKLSAEAYEIVGPMCHLNLSALSKGGRAVQKEDAEAGSSLEIISEGMPLTVAQEQDMDRKPKVTIREKIVELSDDGEKLGEGQLTELPLTPKRKQRVSLAAS
ncbi:uncharacterized protein Triagg1_3169 [Trichoderma aggressivum f. europaeum]|uniref:Bacteriophage T5 Orf172 DNA-binding domain-containing protein n=1 Tax=Trichoderma aggressivum f. europaeum TaxID=173218 RepID=A0AAE1IGF8_9HYPO|nr:hypothetical protein Triagg1_3169 [Trichoderma aggressivum f. europaeum]